VRFNLILEFFSLNLFHLVKRVNFLDYMKSPIKEVLG